MPGNIHSTPPPDGVKDKLIWATENVISPAVQSHLANDLLKQISEKTALITKMKSNKAIGSDHLESNMKEKEDMKKEYKKITGIAWRKKHKPVPTKYDDIDDSDNDNADDSVHMNEVADVTQSSMQPGQGSPKVTEEISLEALIANNMQKEPVKPQMKCS